MGTRNASNTTGPASEIGTVLANRYEVVRELGRGGMGIVYLCRDVVVGDRVALKRLRVPDDGGERGPQETLWFHQEARAVANLEHPAIVRARDFGMLPDDTPFLVMDILPGRSVHEWMHTTQLPYTVVWAMVDQVLAGLAHVHARGIIHGDLKPSNIMLDLASGSRGPRAYMLDLGLAWLFQTHHDPRLDPSEVKTQWHSGAGTVGWVAPEQIAKQAPFVGPGTDLYALGCVMYRVFSGKEVFEGAPKDVLRAHNSHAVPPPKVPDDTPPEVAQYICRLLEKQPWRRFEFAADARRAWLELKPPHAMVLEKVLAEQPEQRPSALMSSLPSSHAQKLTPGLLALRALPIVARHAERDELLDEVKLVCKGTGPLQRMIVLKGDAGVGKSRLVQWLSEQVHERGEMIPLRARYGRIPTPIDGFTAAVKSHFGFDDSLNLTSPDIEKLLMARWEISKSDDDGLTWVAATTEWLNPPKPGAIPELGPTGKRFTLDQPQLRWRVAHYVLSRIGMNRPILLWLDDVHLASANTFEMLSALRRMADRLRILIVATVRAESLATDPAAEARIHRLRDEWSGRTMEVRPLSQEETESLLLSALPLHEEALRRATVQSRGNPLFALQLLYAWAGGGFFNLEQGTYAVPDEVLQQSAGTTAELWDERIRAISPKLKDAALSASALGEDIRRPVLDELVRAMGLDPREVVFALTRAQILVDAGRDQLGWPHALLQEHLAERLRQRDDAAVIYRLAANALAKHPAVGSRRIMRLRVKNLLLANAPDAAADLMFAFFDGTWSRGRDASAILKDLDLLRGALSGRHEADSARWEAEARRYVGDLVEARKKAEAARETFRRLGETGRELHVLRLLGHIASDLGQPKKARDLVSQAIERCAELADHTGQARAEVVLGEIDYLLGDHQVARKTLEAAAQRFRTGDDPLGHAQCMLLLGLIENSFGSLLRARELVVNARASFEGIGYRLGAAQCDAVLAHTDHRAFDMTAARSRALAARATFRQLENPRGEAACERLLALVAFDMDDFAAATAHAQDALRLYSKKLIDPWGEVESRCILAQIALATGSGHAERLVAECEKVRIDEAEPRQHRHLTRAWLAQKKAKWSDASAEIERARSVFPEKGRTGDHTPHLLKRFATFAWMGPAMPKIEAWQRQLEQMETDGAKPT